MIDQTLHKKLKIEKHKPSKKKRGGTELGCFRRVSSFCSTGDTRRFTLYKECIKRREQ